MDVSPESAEESIKIIERTSEQTRETAGRAGAPFLILWGVIWVAGFGILQFAPQAANRAWLVLDVVGGILTWRFCLTKAEIKSNNDRRMFLGLFLLFAYAAIWAWLLAPFNPRHFGGYLVTVVMCGYVVAGMWLGRFYIYLGATITALVIAGALFMPRYESLWLAVTGGGALIASGLYLRRTRNRVSA